MDVSSAALNVNGADGWSVGMAAMAMSQQRLEGADVLKLEQSAIPAERYGVGQNVNLLA